MVVSVCYTNVPTSFIQIVLVVEIDVLQFGCKAGVSTTQCTFTLLETISYYNSKNSNVHGYLLDATQAFYRVNFL